MGRPTPPPCTFEAQPLFPPPSPSYTLYHQSSDLHHSKYFYLLEQNPMSPFSIGIASGNESGVKWPAPFIETTFPTKLSAFVIVILISDLANKTFFASFKLCLGMLYVLLGKIRNVWKADKLQSFPQQLNLQKKLSSLQSSESRFEDVSIWCLPSEYGCISISFEWQA